MLMTLELTTDEIDALRKAALPWCNEADVQAAVKRYPGEKNYESDFFIPNATIDDLTKKCLSLIKLEGPYLDIAFLLRLLEQKWGEEEVRRKVVVAMPTLLRPPPGFSSQIATLASAFDFLARQLAETPDVGAVGDVDVFRRFCEARSAVEDMVGTLRRLESLKGAHDGLQMLQVLGSECLDLFVPASSVSRSTETLLPLLERTKESFAPPSPDLHLPSEIEDVFARCLLACEDAERRIQSGDSREAAFATEVLRATLMRNLPVFDVAMFATSREFDLRRLCDVFRSKSSDPMLENARRAAVDFADTLRRRLMEHYLWQTLDRRLYALEAGLAQPTATITEFLQKTLPWLGRDLRALLDPPAADRVFPPLNSAVLKHILTTTEGASPEQLRNSPTLDAIRGAFHDLRSCARSAFFAIDLALKRDLTQLLILKAPLEAILIRVPPHCELLIP
jgi:hypothetical protein